MMERSRADSEHHLEINPMRLLKVGVRSKGMRNQGVLVEQLCGCTIIHRCRANNGVKRTKSSVLNMLQLRFLLTSLVECVFQGVRWI